MVDWCSINDGTIYQWERELEKVTSALYQAALLTDFAVAYFGKRIDIDLGSTGFVLPIFDGSGVVDFRFVPNPVWCIGLKIGILPPIKIPLPKKDLTGLIIDFLKQVDFELATSRNWKYRDTDGIVKSGSDCIIPRGFMFFQDGIPVIKPFVLFGIIYWIIKELGLDDLVKRFIQSYYATALNRRIKRNLDEIAEGMDDYQESLDSVPVTEAMDLLELNRQGIQDVSEKVGVRLLLR